MLCQALEIRGPPPQERPEQGEEGYSKAPVYRKAPSPSAFLRAHPHPYWPPVSKAPHVQVGTPRSDRQVPRAKSHENPEPPGMYRAARRSPAYQTPEEGIWDQSYLSKALQQMRDREVVKLKFPPNSSKPLEYEKWVTLVGTTMKGLHPEIGIYWERAVASAEKSYQNYIKDVSYTRVRFSR